MVLAVADATDVPEVAPPSFVPVERTAPDAATEPP